jgi:hypothetical protein
VATDYYNTIAIPSYLEDMELNKIQIYNSRSLHRGNRIFIYRGDYNNK